MKILIADDEKGFTEILEERLTFKGCSVDIAHDGKKALELLESNVYDLVFLDHNMPELTGLELAKHIKVNKLTTKTVIITGYPEIEGFFAKAVGADEFLAKPVKIRDIEKLINKYGASSKK